MSRRDLEPEQFLNFEFQFWIVAAFQARDWPWPTENGFDSQVRAARQGSAVEPFGKD